MCRKTSINPSFWSTLLPLCSCLWSWRTVRMTIKGYVTVDEMTRFLGNHTFRYSRGNKNILRIKPKSINLKQLLEFFIADKIDRGVWNWQSFKQWSESFLLLWKKYLSDHLPHNFHGFGGIVLPVLGMQVLNHHSRSDYPDWVGYNVAYRPCHGCGQEILHVAVVPFVLEHALRILINRKEQRMKCRYGDHVRPISLFKDNVYLCKSLSAPPLCK